MKVTAFKRYIFEAPHVFYQDIFDLEKELYTDSKGLFKSQEDKRKFVEKLKDVLSGKPVKDKHGFVVLLNNPQQKQMFYDSIKDDMQAFPSEAQLKKVLKKAFNPESYITKEEVEAIYNEVVKNEG